MGAITRISLYQDSTVIFLIEYGAKSGIWGSAFKINI